MLFVPRWLRKFVCIRHFMCFRINNFQYLFLPRRCHSYWGCRNRLLIYHPLLHESCWWLSRLVENTRGLAKWRGYNTEIKQMKAKRIYWIINYPNFSIPSSLTTLKDFRSSVCRNFMYLWGRSLTYINANTKKLRKINVRIKLSSIRHRKDICIISTGIINCWMIIRWRRRKCAYLNIKKKKLKWEKKGSIF